MNIGKHIAAFLLMVFALCTLGVFTVSAQPIDWGNNNNQGGGTPSSNTNTPPTTFPGGEQVGNPLTPLAPEGFLAKDYIVNTTAAVASSGLLFEDLIARFVLVPEAERRGHLKNNFFNSWTIGEKDAETLTEAEVAESIKNNPTSVGNGGTLISYPNQLNAKYWRLTPSTMVEGAGIDHRVSVLPLPNDTTTPHIFPLSETLKFSVQDPTTNNSKEIPIFTETFKSMLRLKKDYFDGDQGCQGGCVVNPFTGLKADRAMTEAGIDGRLWHNLIAGCAERGGRLPRAEEAWYFLASKKWTLLPDELSMLQGFSSYYVLTGDMLDIETDHAWREEFPEYGINGVDILGIKVKEATSTTLPAYNVRGFDYEITFDAMTQLGQHAFAHGKNPRGEYDRSVAYCVYD